VHSLAQAYRDHRSVLLSIAYRMLGSFGDAEDVVQEAFIRYGAALDGGLRPDSERAYLTTVTTRLAIDHLRSARVRREQYVGPWLPEPAVAGMTDLSDDAALADSLSTAFLVLLERATPEQRAALLLRDVFDLPYDQIAAVLGRSEVACRQLATRARRWVRRPEGRFETDRSRARELAEGFFAAAREGDLPRLVALLVEDAEFVGDGGDSGRGVTRIVRGRETVGALVGSLVGRLLDLGVRMEPAEVGAQPAVLLRDEDDLLVGVWTLVVESGRVAAVHGIVNPDKLAHLGLELNIVRLRGHGGPAVG
jgi:RNA polymerase sigma factor (sigma-70 family)